MYGAFTREKSSSLHSTVRPATSVRGGGKLQKQGRLERRERRPEVERERAKRLG